MAMQHDYCAEVTEMLCEMDRVGLIDAITHYRGRFKLDFRGEYLDTLTVSQLRHILAAAMLQNARIRTY